MNWIKTCFRNQLIVYIISILICLLGIFCIYIMPIAPFPSVQFNDFDITVNYPGANAETVQRQVTSKIVTNLQAINNVQQITSSTQAGMADINITFDPKLQPVDLLQSQMQMIQAIDSSNLPSVVPQPIVTMDQGTSWLVNYVLTSPTASAFELQNFIQAVLVPKFNTIPQTFVQNVTADPAIKIALKPEAIAAYQLDPYAISQLLNATYQSDPLGSIDIAQQPYILNMPDNLASINALNNLIVGYQYADQTSDKTPYLGRPIYLKDVANISFESRDVTPSSVHLMNDQNAAAISINTSTNANPFLASKVANDFVNSLQDHLPDNIQIKTIYDVSILMLESINDVVLTIFISSLLVLSIALIFLGRFKATIIPIVTIPVCLLGAMIFVYLAGYSLNLITLLALVIAVGLVVDDAIVVVENISRYLEQGVKKQEAVIRGSQEIALTIIGITLTLVVVYIPILFSANQVSELFKPFAITLAGAVFISGLVALTLTPVMAALLLSDKPLNAYQLKFEHYLARIIARYHRLLKVVLAHRITALSVIVILIAAATMIAVNLPKQIFPDDPQGTVGINVVGTPQDNIQTIEAKLAPFRTFYTDPAVAFYTTNIRKDYYTKILSGDVNLELKPEYLKSSNALADKINQFISAQHLSNVYAKSYNISNWGGDYDISLNIYSGDPDKTNQAALRLTQLLKNSPQFSFVNNQINLPQKQLVFNIDEPKAASLGILRQSISQLLSVYYGGYTLNNYFDIAGLSVPIVVQLSDMDLQDPASLQKLMIQSPITHQYYPISNFVSLETAAKPLMITTFNGLPSVEIDTTLNKGYSMGDTIAYINGLMNTEFPDMQYQYTGNALGYLQSNNETLLIVILGILCVYFLLTILFRNLADPLIIMLTVPFSILGGCVTLWLFHATINLYSALGLITLIGLITKHGVLITQFANHELQKGASVTEAVLTATHHRFRPIIMTTLAMVFGALPLVFSSNIFYMSRFNLGVTLVGGLLVGTLFSLFIVPLVYTLIKKAEGKS